MGEPKGNIEAALPKRPPDGLPDIGVLPDFLDEGSIPHKNSFFYPNRQAESLKHLCTHQLSHLENKQPKELLKIFSRLGIIHHVLSACENKPPNIEYVPSPPFVL